MNYKIQVPLVTNVQSNEINIGSEIIVPNEDGFINVSKMIKHGKPDLSFTRMMEKGGSMPKVNQLARIIRKEENLRDKAEVTQQICYREKSDSTRIWAHPDLARTLANFMSDEVNDEFSKFMKNTVLTSIKKTKSEQYIQKLKTTISEKDNLLDALTERLEILSQEKKELSEYYETTIEKLSLELSETRSDLDVFKDKIEHECTTKSHYDEWTNKWKTVYQYMYDKHDRVLTESETRKLDNAVSKKYKERYENSDIYKPLWKQIDKYNDLILEKPLQKNSHIPSKPVSPTSFKNLSPRSLHTFFEKDWDLIEQETFSEKV